jgi:hypothetical protein
MYSDYFRTVDLSAEIRTDGKGLWSRATKKVRLTQMSLNATNYEDGFLLGELRVGFDTGTWDVEEDGLIYTDPKFIRHLRQYLSELGLAGADVDYSEQGMQGEDHVSCDVGRDFIASFFKKYEITPCPVNDESSLKLSTS